jgi:hypothetical protein
LMMSERSNPHQSHNHYEIYQADGGISGESDEKTISQKTETAMKTSSKTVAKTVLKTLNTKKILIEVNPTSPILPPAGEIWSTKVFPDIFKDRSSVGTEESADGESSDVTKENTQKENLEKENIEEENIEKETREKQLDKRIAVDKKRINEQISSAKFSSSESDGLVGVPEASVIYGKNRRRREVFSTGPVTGSNESDTDVTDWPLSANSGDRDAMSDFFRKSAGHPSYLNTEVL